MKALSSRTAVLILVAGSPLHAATKTWDAGAANANWSDAVNWNADGIPTSSDAVLLDNSTVNPLPQINAQSGSNCGTLTIDGAISGTFLNYGGATPYVLNLHGASVNAANTGPLINITTNAPTSLTANKVNFQLRTNGELFVASGKTFTLSNSSITQNGTRSLTKTGAGTVRFSGSGSLVSFTGGLNMAEGVWNASADTEDLPVAGTITFTNLPGTAATITSTNSHSIAALAGGNSNSEFHATGSTGLTLTGSATTTFSGRLRGNTKLTHNGSGSLTLNGSNTFTGATTINAGTLALGSSGSISGTPSIAIASGATFHVSALAAGFTLGTGKSISGGGTVAGKLTLSSDATLAPGGNGVGTLTITNGLTLAAGSHLDLDLNGPASHDAVTVSGGNVSLATSLDATLGYSPAIGDTLYLVRNTGPGTTTGTLSGIADGGKIDIGGKWWRVSFTSDHGGAGFLTNGTGNDLAIQRIDEPSPSGTSVTAVGATDKAVVQLQFSWLDNSATETGYHVYRVLADGSLELAATLPADSTGFSDTVGNYTSPTYAVQAFDAAGPIGEPTYSPPFQAATGFTQRRDAMLDYLSTVVPNLGQFGGGPHRIGRTGFWCATGRLLRGDTATGISYITTSVEDADAEGGNAGFSMWPGMDAYLRWSHLFPQSLKDRYQQVYVGSGAYNDGSTPNQRFMLATASYLANGVWGPGVNSVASASNGFGGASGKDFILHILNKTPFDNHEEHNSHHYLTYTLSAIETLAEFAQDAEVRDKARLVVSWALAEASGYMHNGRWCVSSTRGRAALRQNDYGNTDWTWHILFGGPPPTSYFDSFATAPFLTPQFPAALPEVLASGQDRTQSHTRRSLAQRYLGGGDVAYFKQAWMTPGYALWSQVEGDVTYNADGSLNLLDVNTAGIQDGYQGNRWGLAWDSPPGNDAMITITTPTTYSGSTSGISVWEDTLQHEDTVIAVYNMPVGGGGSTGNNGNWANEYIKGDIPNGYLAYIDQSDALGRIFLHYDSVLVSIQLTDTFGNYVGSPGFQYPCNKQGVIVETALPSEYPQATAADRLLAFRADILANTVTDKTGINDAAPKLIYTNRHGEVLELTFGLAGKINGVTVDYQSWPMLENPWMRQSQNGHLHLFGANRIVTSNYYDWTESTNHRPAADTMAALPATSGTPVDIDLAARVADSETPDNQLHFAVSNPSNGNVTLLPDGKTARFTPTASGPASFDFTTRDRGLHPAVVWHYDFETSATHDTSLHRRHATQTLVTGGTATLESDTSAALGSNSTQSLRLTEATPAAAKLSRLVTRSNLEMSNGSWTFATWFKRANRSTEDFIFYIGAGDGFSGNGDELQLRCGANADTLRLEHYNASNAGDLTLISPGTAVQNVWHHAAVTFEKTADNTGTVRLYLNGTLAGSPTPVTWALRQDLALVLGGVTSTSSAVTSRYFNGWLDDSALFRGAMSAADIASLAKQSVATFSGLSANASVTLSASAASPWEDWRAANFNTAELADPLVSGPDADKDRDGIVNLLEYATATLPGIPNTIPASVEKNGATLEFTYTRNKAATDLEFLVKWSETLAPGSWSTIGIADQNPEPQSETATTETLRILVPAGTVRRFVRLEVTQP
jgi:autotransporter-associated beta strand protein